MFTTINFPHIGLVVNSIISFPRLKVPTLKGSYDFCGTWSKIDKTNNYILVNLHYQSCITGEVITEDELFGMFFI